MKTFNAIKEGGELINMHVIPMNINKALNYPIVANQSSTIVIPHNSHTNQASQLNPPLRMGSHTPGNCIITHFFDVLNIYKSA